MEVKYKNIAKMTLDEHIQQFKLVIIDIISDLKHLRFNSVKSFINIFIDGNRSFYFGIILIIISIIVLLVSKRSKS